MILQHQTWHISRLIDYANNPRKNDHAVDRIAAAIQAFGFRIPVVARSDGTVVDGHLRLKAARLLGMTEIPVVLADDLTDAQIKAFRISVNKMAELAEWDEDLLRAELQDLQGIEFDMDLLGFDVETLEDLLYVEPDRDDSKDDEVPEVPANPVSKPGDVWLLGKHRVMCGDSTDIDQIKILMNGKKADMIFTDPPYGVSIGDKNKMLNSFQKSGRILDNLEGDTLSPDELYLILIKAFKNAHLMLNNCGAVYVCSPQGGGLGMMMMMMMMKDAGLEVRHILNWIKNSPTFSLGRLDYEYQHEPILFTWKKTHKKIMSGDHKTSCWFIDKPRESKLHPTMKPVSLPKNAILNSSERNDIVLDLFGGAGSTLISCEKTQRINRTMEISPAYCDVIVKRFQEYTGQQAIHEATGHTLTN
jgi:DNA modification methylase